MYNNTYGSCKISTFVVGNYPFDIYGKYLELSLIGNYLPSAFWIKYTYPHVH